MGVQAKVNLYKSRFAAIRSIADQNASAYDKIIANHRLMVSHLRNPILKDLTTLGVEGVVRTNELSMKILGESIDAYSSELKSESERLFADEERRQTQEVESKVAIRHEDEARIAREAQAKRLAEEDAQRAAQEAARRINEE